MKYCGRFNTTLVCIMLTILLTITACNNKINNHAATNNIMPAQLKLTLNSKETNVGNIVNATVALAKNVDMSTNVNVEIFTDSDIATITPQICIIDKVTHYCDFIIETKKTGDIGFIAKANGYTSSSLQKLHINPKLLIQLQKNKILIDEEVTGTVSIGQSQTQDIVVLLSISNDALATLNNKECKILANNTYCSFKIKGKQKTDNTPVSITAQYPGYADANFDNIIIVDKPALSILNLNDKLFINAPVKFTVSRADQDNSSPLTLAIHADNNGTPFDSTCIMASNQSETECSIDHIILQIGKLSITVSADDYDEVTKNATIINPIISVNIAKHKLLVNSSTVISASIPNYIVLSNPITIFFASSDDHNSISFNQSSCEISAKTPTDNSCTITATANQLANNDVVITASATGYYNGADIIYTIDKPIINLYPIKTTLNPKDSTVMNISIADVAGFDGELLVNISSSNNNILKIDKTSCTLSNAAPICSVTLSSNNITHLMKNVTVTVTGDKIDNTSQQFRINGGPL
jgi:hypothetical protein